MPAKFNNNHSSLQTDPIRNFRFLVQFEPVSDKAAKFNFQPTLGFTSVSGLSINTESIPYREGGYNTTIHQIPGQSTFSPITLQRGMLLGSPQHWNWMKRMFSVTGQTTDFGGNFRCNLNIFVLAHPANALTTPGTDGIASANKDGLVINDKVHMKFRVYNAWPTSIAYSDLNSGDNALVVEQMTLVHEGFDMALAKDPVSDVKTSLSPV
jgi:phage tail-like protein